LRNSESGVSHIMDGTYHRARDKWGIAQEICGKHGTHLEGVLCGCGMRILVVTRQMKAICRGLKVADWRWPVPTCFPVSHM
jgi:hypothetical protein